MSDKYACYCGKILTSELELIQHIKDNHVQVIKNENNLSTIIEIIKKEFPGVEVKAYNGERYECKLRFELKWKSIIIEQLFGNNSNSYASRLNPETIDSLIQDIDSKIKIINKIEREVKKLGEFEYFKCEKFDCGYTPNEDRYKFLYKLENKNYNNKEQDIAYYYPWGDFYNNENEFINSFKIYFLKEIEGIPKEILNEGYFDGYSINGINVTPLFESGKKIKLTVLEE